MLPVDYFLISDYRSMELLGVKGLFTPLSVVGSSLPKGFFKYSIREAEGDPFASVNNDIFSNRVGDFICKTELDLKGGEELDLFGDYSFTREKVDLDAFFGEERKEMLAAALEDFVYTYDTYEYQDAVPSGCTREDVVSSIYEGLSDKAYVGGVIKYYETILSNHEAEPYLPADVLQKVSFFITTLREINNNNRDRLDIIVDKANAMKMQQGNASQGKEPEIQ